MPNLTEDEFWEDAQREVIGHKEGPLQVIACAGSGKTATISARIAQMVRDGVDRDSIVAFTFTDNAAEELQVRIRNYMEQANPENPILGNMFVGTIHGFCLDRILQEYDQDTLSYDVLNDNQLSAFLSHKYPSIELHELEGPPYGKPAKINNFKKDIDSIRRELVEGEVRDIDDEETQKFLEVYDSFKEELDDSHFFDYQDIIYKSIRLLEENPDIRRKVNEEYKYIIVDEYQDVNTCQERLIELLGGDSQNICVVGDDDQSIYRWRGARTENFLNFEDKYGADVSRLEKNFRSTELIADIASTNIQRNTRRLEKDMYSDSSAQVGDVYQVYFQSDEEEAEFIADKIEHHVNTVFEDPSSGESRPLSYGDFAILFRRKKDMEIYQEALADRGIDFTIRGQDSVFGRPETELVRLAFGYIAQGIDPNLEIIDLENSDRSRFGDTEWMSVDENMLRQTIRQSNLLEDREEAILEELNRKQQRYEENEQLREADGQDAMFRRIHPQDELHDILAVMGMNEAEDGYSSEAFPEAIMYELGQISELFKDFETVYEIIFPDQLEDLVRFLDYSAHHANPQIEDPTLFEAVNLMTIHSAKGTEYPAVFVPGLTTTKFRTSRQGGTRNSWLPDSVFNPAEYEEDTENYRRLFHVAITRAKKFLFLTGAVQNRGYDNNQYSNEFFDEVSEAGHSLVLDEPEEDPTPRQPEEPEEIDPEFTYPTSFSDIRYYKKCPYDYKMRNIYNFAPTIDSAFGYGFAVHDILREIHEGFEEDQESILPSPGEVEIMVQNPERFYLRYARGEVDQNLRDKATEILKDYASEYSEDIRLTYRAEEPFEYLISRDDGNSTALVSGEIDLLEKVNEDTGEVEEVSIIDFKTEEEPDTEFDPKLRDTKFQVRLYTLATKSEFDLSAVEGNIHYLNERNRREVDLSSPKLEQAEQTINDSVEQIMDRQFFATPSEDICSSCDFNDICPHAED